MQIDEQDVEDLVIKYLNRLSDYLFVVARYVGYLQKAEEVQWKPRF
jgi:cob(I)alamin adenosyltransferase